MQVGTTRVHANQATKMLIIIKPSSSTSFVVPRKPTHARNISTTTRLNVVVAMGPHRAQVPGQRAPLAPRASVATAATLPSLWGNDKSKQALLKLARVHNLVPSILLVFLGAWVRVQKQLLRTTHAA